MLRFFDKRIEKELCSTFHDRIRALQKSLIPGELVVIPEMRAQPCAARWPESPQWTIDRRGGSPEIGVVMTNPAARSILYSRRVTSVFYEFSHHSSQWFMTLRQIRSLRRPVVHLRVDI